MKTFLKIILLLILTASANHLSAQSKPDEQGFEASKKSAVELYVKGNFRDAINSFKKISKMKEAKNDGDVWNYLGLAYMGNDDLKNSRKALERATRLSPQNAVFYSNLAYVYLLEKKTDKAQNAVGKALSINPQSANAYYIRGTANLWENKYESALEDAEKAISFNDKFSSAYVLKSDLMTYKFGRSLTEKAAPEVYLKWLEEAQTALKICTEKCTKDENYPSILERTDSVNAFYEYYKKRSQKEAAATLTPTSVDPNSMQIDPAPNVAQNDANKTPLRILAKPRAGYTERARTNGVSGTVRLAVVFAADATVKHILILQGLGFGLTEEAVNAARQIRFEPEKENGKPVTVVRIVQYSFAVY